VAGLRTGSDGAPSLAEDFRALERVAVAAGPVAAAVGDACHGLDPEVTIAVRGVPRQRGRGALDVDVVVACAARAVELEQAADRCVVDTAL
jgi:hypothetical protein